MSACPQCFQQLHATYHAWTCMSPECPRTLSERASLYRNSDVEHGPYKEWNVATQGPLPDSVVCDSCSKPMTEICPVCLAPIPPAWREADTVTIAMNGARWTGKTIYIAIMIQQLQHLLARHDTVISPYDATTKRVYETVYLPQLFEAAGVPNATPPSEQEGAFQRDPMIFSLGVLKGRQRFLVIRDVAGEEMEVLPAKRTQLEFFRYADAILFMFDPMAVSEIKQRLTGIVPDSQTGGLPRTVLNNLLELLGPARPPLGIVVSKFDALQRLSEVQDQSWSHVMRNLGAGYLRDPGIDAKDFDTKDGELVSLEVESLLHRLNARELLITLRNPPGGGSFDYRFFAVSALGHPTEGTKLSEFGISSYRVLDPVKWALSRRGII